MEPGEPRQTSAHERVAGTAPPNAEERERAHRREALSALARQTLAHEGSQSGEHAIAAERGSERRGRRRRIALSAVLAVVIVAVAALAVLNATRRTPVAATIPSRITIDLHAARLYCLSSVVWSPDGTHLAFHADPYDCATAPATNPPSPVVAIFDARNGRLERTLKPYDALRQLGASNPSDLTRFVWSADGKSLIFFVGYAFTHVDAVPSSGLLYLPLDGGAPRYVSGPAVPFTSTVVWDLTAGKATSVIAGQIAPAAGYRFTDDGHIVPDTTADGIAGGPSSFYQAGTILPIPYVSGTQIGPPNAPPAALIYRSVRTLRSPDGRFAAFGLPLTARFAPPAGVTLSPLNAPTCQAADSPLLPVCEALPAPEGGAALTTAVAAAAAGHTSTQPNSQVTLTFWPEVDLAWRPDGKVVAALLPGDGFSANEKPSARVAILSALSGRPLGGVLVDRTLNGYGTVDGVPPLYWSPTGDALAVADFFGERFTIVRASALPAA